MPGFNVFGGVGRGSATLFEIRLWLPSKGARSPLLTANSLDNDIIVLRGSESESSSQMLKGVVVLCLHAALKVEDVHLKLHGQLKVG